MNSARGKLLYSFFSISITNTLQHTSSGQEFHLYQFFIIDMQLFRNVRIFCVPISVAILVLVPIAMPVAITV